MSRPLRIEFPGAVYHVTSRGDRREAIYADDADRHAQLEVLGEALDRFDAEVLAYCQMGNHYHLVLHTRQGNLSRLMRHFNGVYTQAFNRRHGLVGHLFQGRFKAILVDRDEYLFALCRYVERNPVAARLVEHPAEWPWSSCRAHLGQAAVPPWLDADGLHGFLLGRPVADGRDRRQAQRRYAALIEEPQPADGAFWQGQLRQQIYLGSEAFVAQMQAHAEPARCSTRAVPKVQRGTLLTWEACLRQAKGDRARALLLGYREGGMTMMALARQAQLSVSHVSRLIRGLEAEGTSSKK